VNRFWRNNNQTNTPVTHRVGGLSGAFCARNQRVDVMTIVLSIADGGRGSSG
jgi:hypothetical protein